ncbi:hypothetical protein F400_gp051 [Bacillus phage BCD7]|uniref:Uncharacterized protein n=1 Tax=Bacillus phage BCD7 TaxID=1136534 RepID=J9PTY3_9CAUD|nr:hypothetical protein F400_gp051 [Bacillus phage BCD7]AEZ50498.1 hypothetical protein BCD7_0051 [Bacillus phage BCD7]
MKDKPFKPIDVPVNVLGKHIVVHFQDFMRFHVEIISRDLELESLTRELLTKASIVVNDFPFHAENMKALIREIIITKMNELLESGQIRRKLNVSHQL